MITLLVILAFIFTLLHLFSVPSRVSWLGLGVLCLSVVALVGTGVLSNLPSL